MIYVPPPNGNERLQILSVYTRNMPLEGNVDLKKVVFETDGYTGADLESLCREAAVLAIREKAEKVSSTHLEQATKKYIQRSLLKW